MTDPSPSTTAHDPDSPVDPQPRWIGIALLALLVVSFGLRAWDASQGLNAHRYYDERYALKNISGILLHGEIRPRNAFYTSLSYLPQTAALAASQWLFEVTRYEPFAIYSASSDGYSPTAYLICRLINVLYGTLSLWVLFLIGRRLYSPGVGLLAAAILAAFGRHVQSSGELKPDILVLFLVTLTFYWTLAAAFRPSLRRFLLVGVGVGLGVSAKYTGVAGAIPLTAAVLAEGRRDRRQWLWLVLAGVASVVTFVILNPFLDVVLDSISFLSHTYAATGTEEESGHWVVFTRQIQFLIDHHGPIVTAFVGLGVLGLLWRIFRPGAGLSPEERRERRLGSILLLSLLLGYSVLHALGMTLFRGQNYLPVVPFSSLAAAWAMVELWRWVCLRLPWLAWRPVAALLWAGVGAALVAQQETLVYVRVVPTTFSLVNAELLAELDPTGLRHVVYERSLGTFDSGGKPRRPLVTPVDRLTAVPPAFLDGTDVEVFPQSRLDGPAADFYRDRVARCAKNQVEIVGDRWFRSRGEPIVILRHLWELVGDPVNLQVRRPDEDSPFLVGRVPEGLAKPGGTVSLMFWVPRGAEGRNVDQLRLDPGGRSVPIFDTGRRLNHLFWTSTRFTLTGTEQRVRVPSIGTDDPARGYGLELYEWRPGGGGAALRVAARPRPLITPALFSRPLPPPTPGEEGETLLGLFGADGSPLPVWEGGGDGRGARGEGSIPPRHIPQRPQLLLLLRRQLRTVTSRFARRDLLAVGGHPDVLELAGHLIGLAGIVQRLDTGRGPAQKGELRDFAAAAGEGDDDLELLLQPVEDRLRGLGQGRHGLAADAGVAGPVVVRLRVAEAALPEELEVPLHQREAVDAVAQVELGEGAFVERLEEAGRRARLRAAAGGLDQRGGYPHVGGPDGRHGELAREPLRQLDHQRHVHQHPPEIAAVGDLAVLLELLPMIGGHHEEGLSPLPAVLQGGDQAGEHLVRVGGVELVHCPEDALLVRRQLHRGVIVGLEVERPDVPREIGWDLVEPVEEGVAAGVRRVRGQDVDPDEVLPPLQLPEIALGPLPLPEVVELVEPLVVAERGVQPVVGAEGGGAVARLLQRLRQGDEARVEHRAVARPAPCPPGLEAGEEGRHGGDRPARRRDRAAGPGGLPGERAQGGHDFWRTAEGAHGVRPQGVDGDQHDRTVVDRRLGRPPAAQGDQAEEDRNQWFMDSS
ncbi:MAG TPA: glycosyltransferase family 39 protein [Thermoanaerobaculia bacterium]